MTTPDSEQGLTPLSDPDNLMFEIVEDKGFTDEQIYQLLNGEPLDAVTAAANEDKFGSAMIALIPSEADIARLTLDGYERPEELHLTLFFLGDAEDLEVNVQALIVDAITNLHPTDPIKGFAFGASQWNPTGDEPAWVLNVGDAVQGSNDLHTIREIVNDHLSFLEVGYPTQHTPWSPHICIAYSKENLFEEIVSRVGPVTFDRIRVAVSRDVTDIPLG